jgi:hypothetical protein
MCEKLLFYMIMFLKSVFNKNSIKANKQAQCRIYATKKAASTKIRPHTKTRAMNYFLSLIFQYTRNSTLSLNGSYPTEYT